MKEDTSFQENTPNQYWEFAPNSSWLVFTDCVSHAVLSGQYALKQTFLIPQDAWLHRSARRSPYLRESQAAASLFSCTSNLSSANARLCSGRPVAFGRRAVLLVLVKVQLRRS
jgi:hypothetical protein